MSLIISKGLLLLKYKHYNTKVLDICLSSIRQHISDEQMQAYLEMALNKALNPKAINPAPPLLSYLLLDDLEVESEKFFPLFKACAYFYTAADLLDDIQDKNPHQPILENTSPEQAMNIYNSLLMMSYKNLSDIDLPSTRKCHLFELFTQMGMLMSTGQFWDISATNTLNPSYDPQEIARYKAGAELAGFMACIPCALGLNIKLFYKLGEQLGILLQIISDYMDIWMIPHSQALSEDLAVLKNTLPLCTALKDPQWSQDVHIALSGDNTAPKKQFALRRLLVQTTAIETLKSTMHDLTNKIAGIYRELPDLPRIQELTQFYIEQAQELIKGLEKLKTITQNSPWTPYRSTEQSLKIAADYLRFIPDFKDAWEVQRWGFLDQEALYGDIFTPLLILEALRSEGESIQIPFLDILQKRSEHGWHYYSNSSQIPPDADDLAQILHLSNDLSPAEKAQWIDPVLHLLLKNIESSGKCPTWISDPQIYPRSHVEKHWYGNECIAVMANLYYGLACYNAQHYEQEVQRGVEYLIDQYTPSSFGWPSTHYSSKRYTLYLVGRLFQKQDVQFDFQEIIVKLISEQLLNGSWDNSPQETAFAILFLSTCLTSHPLSLNVKKALNFILEHQSYDGSWAGENLFIRPGRDARYEYFQHSKLTTAFCLRAIHSTHTLI